MSPRRPPRASATAVYEAEVAAYIAAGGNEQTQRVITAVHGLTRRLSQFYTAQLVDLDVSAGEWGVISRLATTPKDAISTPSSLAAALAIAPSSMTHRLDKMSERGLILRTPDTTNRTRMIVTLTSAGWEMFRKTIQAGDVVESDVLAQLSETERETLADLLERAIAGLDDALGS